MGSQTGAAKRENNIKRIMGTYGIDRQKAMRGYRKYLSQLDDVSNPVSADSNGVVHVSGRKRRSSVQVMKDNFDLVETFVRKCGGIEQAKNALGFFEHVRSRKG